jgi:hypothetical protein
VIIGDKNMIQEIESLLDQNVIKEVLYEIYQKDNQENNALVVKKVIQEMIEKLQPFFRQKPL